MAPPIPYSTTEEQIKVAMGLLLEEMRPVTEPSSASH